MLAKTDWTVPFGWLKRTKRRVLAASKLDYFSSLYGVEMGNRRYDADDTLNRQGDPQGGKYS